MNIRPFISPCECKSWEEFNAYARRLGEEAGKLNAAKRRRVMRPCAFSTSDEALNYDFQVDKDWHEYCDEWTAVEDETWTP